MNLFLRSACAVAVLGIVAGCSGDEGTTPSTAPTTANPSMAPKSPVVPAPSQADTSKEEPSKEMQPAPVKPEEAKKDNEPPKIEGPKTEGSPKGDSAAAKLTSDEIAAIKQLPAADQDVALKQAVCPVSGEHLGEMGKPVKVDVAGRGVFLCCEGCEEKIKADPQKYLAKLDAQAGKK